MNIVELTKRVKENSKNWTKAEQIKMLRDANIIDDDGYYSEIMFSKETVESHRSTGKPFRA